MDIKIKKYNHNPPIVWIDTNVIIDIGKEFRAKTHGRAREIYDKLVNLVEKEKIIVPFVYQRDEYINADDESVDLYDNILMKLSTGKQVRIVRSHIVFKQIERAMEAYILGNDELFLESGDIFYPTNKADIDSQFDVVVLLSGTKIPQLFSDEYLKNNFERRRQEVASLKLSEKEVYESELYVRRDRMSKQNLRDKEKFGDTPFPTQKHSVRYEVLFPMIAWTKLTMMYGNKKKLNEFFESIYYRYVPYDDISSLMVTKMALGDVELKKTDARDLESIANILPYSEYMLVDKAMKGIIQQTKVDKKYFTKVFSLNNYQDFLAEMDQL